MTDEFSGEVILYQRDDGVPALEVRLDAETVWLSQQQISELFQTSRENVTMHLRICATCSTKANLTGRQPVRISYRFAGRVLAPSVALSRTTTSLLGRMINEGAA